MTLKSLLQKIAPTKSVSTRADPSALAGYDLPYVAPIAKYGEAKAALLDAETTEQAIAVILAYVQPKVEDKGRSGDPLAACNYFDKDVPERSDEVQIVRRLFGLHRGLKATYEAGTGGGGAGGGSGF